MSAGIRRTTTDICADCSSPCPAWTSLNRGVLVCDDCCSVHRSLGRHVSEVRSLHHGYWPPTLLELLKTLVSKGANTIWEHALLDPASMKSGRRKPAPKEKLHPTKANFISAKYKLLAYMNRLPVREEDCHALEDLSKQLHASVRTSNLETCLRLLALGARANYLHPDRGNMALHVAASAGQALQCELLVLHGADPCALDSRGHTPVECARIAGYHEMADRLIECQYELTDRLAFYVCGRRPVHVQGEHHILPSLKGSVDVSEPAVAARQKLHALTNSCFEELAADVYDEVDRRETDGVWLATQHHSDYVSNQHPIPFLPVNPAFSATRNQGRQKLATFNARDFATLITDILTDAKRRQMESAGGGHSEGNLVPTNGVEVIQQQHLQRQQQSHLPNQTPPSTTLSQSNAAPPSDLRVDHDYDEVYLESGKIFIGSQSFLKKDLLAKGGDETDGGEQPAPTPEKTAAVSSGTPKTSSPDDHQYPSQHSYQKILAEVSEKDEEEVHRAREQLTGAQERIQQLMQVNSGMGEEIRLLQAMVQKLMQENSMLRTLQLSRSSSPSPHSSSSMYTTSSTASNRRPFSAAGSLGEHHPPPVPIKQKHQHLLSPTLTASTRSLAEGAIPEDCESDTLTIAAFPQNQARDAQTPNSVFGSPMSSRRTSLVSGAADGQSSGVQGLDATKQVTVDTPVLGTKVPETKVPETDRQTDISKIPPAVPPKKKHRAQVGAQHASVEQATQMSTPDKVTVGLQLFPRSESSASITLNTRGANGVSGVSAAQPGTSTDGSTAAGKSGSEGEDGTRSHGHAQNPARRLKVVRSKSSAPVLGDAHSTGSSGGGSPTSRPAAHVNGGDDDIDPDQAKVVQQTEQITKRIQDLLLVAQQQELVKFVPCSRKIATAVNDMASLFVQRPESEGVRTSLRLLVSSASQLQDECREGHNLSSRLRRYDDGSISQEERAQVALVTQRVIQCAYDIAKAAKQLVQFVESS